MRIVVAAALVAALAGASPGAGAPARQGRIAFSLTDSAGASRIFSVRPNGKGLRQVTRPVLPQLWGGDSGPAWSPDGKRIAFQRELPFWTEDRFSLYVAPVRGVAQPTKLTDGDFDVMPAWSPNGRRLAFARSLAPQETLLYGIDSRGRGDAAITTGPYDLAPSWSPDGRTLAFARLTGSPPNAAAPELLLANADGTNVHRLGVAGTAPAWSPDGRRIAFVSLQDGNGRTCMLVCTPNGEIYVMDADGSNLRRLTSSRADDEHPTWSPDGTRIAFSSGFDNRPDGHAPWLMVIRAGGGKPARVGRFAGVHDPAWSPASVS